MRILCTIPNMPALSGGIYYGLQTNEDGVLGMVSEEIDEAAATRLLTIEGFGPYTGDTTVADAAITAARAQATLTVSQLSDARQANDLEHINRHLSKLNQELSDENARLVGENQALKAELEKRGGSVPQEQPQEQPADDVEDTSKKSAPTGRVAKRR